jgi:hypothetical protein
LPPQVIAFTIFTLKKPRARDHSFYLKAPAIPHIPFNSTCAVPPNTVLLSLPIHQIRNQKAEIRNLSESTFPSQVPELTLFNPFYPQGRPRRHSRPSATFNPLQRKIQELNSSVALAKITGINQSLGRRRFVMTRLQFTLGIALAFSTNAFAIDPQTFTVSTAVGAGADAQLNEHNNSGATSGSSGDFNTRTSSNGDRNEIVALRFDLSEHTLAGLSDIKLNIVNFRENSARQVALYGVKQGSIGGTGFYSTEDWDEAGLTAFGDMPGLTVTDGDFITQNLNTDDTIFLGQITFSSLTKGTVETFADPALTAFIRSYTGSPYVTLLLAAAPGYTSTGQARFASKEATALDGGDPVGNPGDFAPYLTFSNVGGAPSVLITKPVAGEDFNAGAEILIEASVTDDGSISKVEFYGGTEGLPLFLGEDLVAPYSFSYSPTEPGTHTIRVVATDGQGLTGEHSVTVDVGIAIPPDVAITSPAEGAVMILGTPIVIAAAVTDDVSVSKVEFFAGTTEPLTLLGEDLTAPYSFSFDPTAPGTYIIRAVGTDNLGLTNSAEVNVTVQEPAVNLAKVTTAVGQGADAQANEHLDSFSGGGSDLNTRTSSAGDRNEIVALRFDLTEYNLAELSEVTLNIINFRINSPRQVALYGVHQGAKGGTELYTTEDWMESGLFDFGDIPGLELPDLDNLTQSISPTSTTPLGQITFVNLAKGTTETFNDPALTDFVRGYTGSKLVTFILAAAPGYTSTGQARFASKEAFALEGDPLGEEPGKFAPFLSFVVGGTAPELKITSMSRTGNELTLQWSGGAGPFNVQRTASLLPVDWSNVATDLTGNSATINIAEGIGFLRVQGR